MGSVALVAELAGLFERDDLVEDGGENAQPRRAQHAEPVGDLAEPQQPIVIGILVVFRRIERIDLMGGGRCVDQRLTRGSDRKFERILGGAKGGGFWIAHLVLVGMRANLPELFRNVSHLGAVAPFDILKVKIGPEPLILLAPRAGLPGLNKLNDLWWQPGLKVRSDAKARFPALSNAARRAHGSQRSPETLGLPMPASVLGDSLTGISPSRCHPIGKSAYRSGCQPETRRGGIGADFRGRHHDRPEDCSSEGRRAADGTACRADHAAGRHNPLCHSASRGVLHQFTILNSEIMQHLLPKSP